MQVVHFIYNKKEIEFKPTGQGHVMVNATQMARLFGKRVDHFLKSDHAKEFIKILELTPFGGSIIPLKKEEIIKTVNGVNTWMHRILALKFAAWLDPSFELWVYSTINKIILGHYKEMKEATIEKIIAEQELAKRKEELIQSNPELAEIFELELKISAADKRRIKAIKASVFQLKLDLHANCN